MKDIENRINDRMRSDKIGVYDLSVRDRIVINPYSKDYKLWNSTVYSRFDNIYNGINYENFTLAGWDTVTTRSRINALLTYGVLRRERGKTYYIFGSKKTEIDKNKIYTVDDTGIVWGAEYGK